MRMRGLVAAVLVALTVTEAQADVSISSKPTQNMNCSDAVCIATNKNANLSVSDLTAMLASGDLTIKTGGGASTIQVMDTFSWTSTSRLTLDAERSVGIHKPVVVAGTGALTIATNDGGSDGDLLFFGGGKIIFWDLASILKINGQAYKLVNTLRSLAHAVYADRYGAVALSETIDASKEGVFERPAVGIPFHGVFEGLGNSIKNFALSNKKTCDRKSLGLFKDATDGMLRDLRLPNAKLSIYAGPHTCTAGILVGEGGYLENIQVTGAVALYGRAGCVGGVAGSAVEIDDSTMAGEISSSAEASGLGGLACSAYAINNSHSTANISGNSGSSVAGLVGGGRVVGSYATGNVTGGFAAGLVLSSQYVDTSFATGAVTSSGTAAGLVAALGLHGQLSNSYALGAVKGGVGYAGGLLGTVDSTAQVTESYSTGSVKMKGKKFDGGFVGYVSADVRVFSDDYWDIGTSGTDVPCGSLSRGCTSILGLADAQLKSGLPEGFDPGIWGESPDVNNGYPYLLANPPQ
jgi:hypothetical protein